MISNNAGFYEYGFDTSYPDKVPAGTYAFRAYKNFNIKEGSVKYLNGATGDNIEILIQDDLTGLSKMAVTVHGHLVTE